LRYNAEEATGILLLNLGGPDSLKAVKPFLFNLFSDRDIIRLGPSFMQKPLAYLISFLRSGKTIEAYKQIGGRSPMTEITREQAQCLEDALNSTESATEEAQSFKVYVGMRYWHPSVSEAVAEIHRAGIKRVIVLPLYPHYSMATTGSSLSELKRVIRGYPIKPFTITEWFDHPLYIDALVERIKDGISSFHADLAVQTSERNIHVLFSAHSLPVKFIEEGDPYVDQIKGTIAAIMKKMDFPWSLSFQSKSGPVEWLKPSTDDTIKELAQQGIRNLLVVPISFVSDHIETLYEIDVLYRNLAGDYEMDLRRTLSLNTSPLLIAAIKNLVMLGMREAGWRE
jgi:ferrochelatase